MTVPGTSVPDTDGRARDAFICYARMDAEHVDVLQRKLEDAGVSVWRDTQDLWPGDDWRAKIRQAIDRESFVFIACFSRASLERGKSHQYNELLQAVDQLRERRVGDRWLFPVRLDDCTIPNYDLGAGRKLDWIQRADLFGDQRDQQADRLVAAVLQELARRGPRAQAEPRPGAAAPGPPPAGHSPDAPGGRGHGRNRTLIAVAALAVVAIVISAFVLVRRDYTPVTADSGATSGTPSPSATSATASASAASGTASASAVSATASTSDTAVTARVFSDKSDEFDTPLGIAVAGGHVWVANFSGNSVTELNEDDGSLVRVLPFANVTALAADGTHVFVGEAEGDGTVSAVNATDGSVAWDKSVDNTAFSSPQRITAADGNVWVANGDNSVTELNADTGSVEKKLRSDSYGFDVLDAIAVVGGHVWVANYSADTVTELNEGNGNLVQILTKPADFIKGPMGIVAASGHLWIANTLSNSLTELNEGDGSLVNAFSADSYGSFLSQTLASDGTHLWIAEGDGSMAELNGADGSQVRVLPAATYHLSRPAAVAAEGNTVWVANGNNSVTELLVR